MYTEELKLPFEVRPIGDRGVADKPHKQEFFEIIVVFEGEGSCCIDLEKHALSAGYVFCIPPGRVHQLKAEERSCGYVVSFGIDFFYLSKESIGRSFYRDVLGQFSYTGMVKKMNGEQERDVRALLASMLKEFECCLPSRAEVLSGLLKVFLIQLQRLATTAGDEEEEDHHVELVNGFCSRLEQHFLTKRSVSDYAAELLVSAHHLNLTIERVTGFPAGYHIQQRVILEAKRLAVFSGDNMKEIASRLGFQDGSCFSKFFKQGAGMNFSRFRQRYAG